MLNHKIFLNYSTTFPYEKLAHHQPCNSISFEFSHENQYNENRISALERKSDEPIHVKSQVGGTWCHYQHFDLPPLVCGKISDWPPPTFFQFGSGWFQQRIRYYRKCCSSDWHSYGSPACRP